MSLLQYKHAVYVQTCKLFADLERLRQERETKEAHEKYDVLSLYIHSWICHRYIALSVVAVFSIELNNTAFIPNVMSKIVLLLFFYFSHLIPWTWCIDAACCYRCHTWHGVCLSVCLLGTLVSLQKWLTWSRCSLVSCEPKEPYIRWGSRSPAGRGTFEGDMCWPIITSLRMTALHLSLFVCWWWWMCLPSACDRWMHSPSWGVTRRWCCILPNYFEHVLQGGGAVGRALELLWAKLLNNLGQSSIMWYRPRGGDALWLGRQPQAWRKVMAAYHQMDDL